MTIIIGKQVTYADHVTGFCGTQVKFVREALELHGVPMWQALSTNRFYAPVFAELRGDNWLKLGSLSIRTKSGDRCQLALIHSYMRPKRSGAYESYFAGASTDHGLVNHDMLDQLREWVRWYASTEVTPSFITCYERWNAVARQDEAHDHAVSELSKLDPDNPPVLRDM